MSIIRFLPSFFRDNAVRAVPGRCPALSNRTPRLEVLESRLQLSAAPAEVAFDTLLQAQVVVPQEAAQEVSDETPSGDIASSAPNQIPIVEPRAEALNEAVGDQMAADSLVCYPVESVSVAARVDALMNQLAQARTDWSAAMEAILDGMNPRLPAVATQNIMRKLGPDNAPGMEEPHDSEPSALEEGALTNPDSTLPAVPGEGELTSGSVGDPLSPEPLGDPAPPGGPGDPIEGPQAQLPVITEFGVIAGMSNVWIASGQVEHDMPWTLTVVFGGLFEGHSVGVNTDGSFLYTLELPGGISGLVSAQAFDQYGLGSNIVFDYIS